MSLKSILLVFATVLLGLSSCTEETAIDVHPKEGFTNKLTFVLSTSPTITKADGATQIATADELNISNCILAIFESEDSGIGKKVCIASYADMTSDKTASNGAPLYSVSLPDGVSLKFATTYKIIIIANPGNLDAYTGCVDYTAFENVIENTLKDGAYNFQSSTLVKQGVLLVGKDTDVPLSNNTTSDDLTIPLTQLAARIDLKIKVDLGKKLISETYTEVDGTSILEEGNIKNTSIGTEVKLSKELVSNLFFKDKKVIVGKKEGADLDGVKAISLADKEMIREHKYSSWTIKELSLMVKNIRGKVIAMLPAVDYEESATELALCNYTFGDPEKSDVLLKYVTFYTYQRNINVLFSDNCFEVVLGGDIHMATIVEKTTVKGDFLMINLKDKNSFTNFIAEANDPDKLELSINRPGNGEGNAVIVENRNTPITEVPGTDKVVGNIGDKIGPYSGSFQIKPKDGGPIALGNRYLVTATIKNLSMPVTLNWEVNSWSNVTIDIPEFN